jgi:quercetin dioxygenase-like cupin family protein
METNMRRTSILATAVLLCLAAPLSALAQDDAGHQASGMDRQELQKTTTNLIGGPITYPTDTAEVTTELVTLEPGGQTGYHTHQVPSWVYVLDGEVELRVDGAEPLRMAAGQVFIEPQDIPMQAFNVADGPTRMLVVSIGAEGQPTGQAAMPATE